MAPQTSAFFRAPLDIRKLIYDQLLQTHDDVCYQRLTERDSDRGTSSPASEQAASAMRLNIKLVNRQIYHEYQDAWNAANPSGALICKALLEPKTTLTDTAFWRAYIANAARFELIARVGSSAEVQDDGYGVNIIFLQGRGPGYRLEWQHMSDAQREWLNISKTTYQAMIIRVEAIIPSMIVTRRQTSNDISGLTWEGAEQLFEAFQMSDLLSAATDAGDGAHARTQDVKMAAWDPLESNNEHAWY
ncbi:hypothetical protein LTR17_007991 [Elasticomyces elasticus]|nr:hypothetical protein LTR17_007991 [Elasticomyces elasticus]